jgi:hypothetical protein
MCHLDCITRQYCEEGVVYRVSRRSSAEFPCGTPPPALDCTASPIERCGDGCDENALDCADTGDLGNAGDGGQGGENG